MQPPLPDLRSLFEEALSVAPDDRAAFVEGIARVDQGVAADLHGLLEADASEASLRPGVERLLREWTEARAKPGQRVGDFEIVRELGGGGMGVVFLARRAGGFEQSVAIKFARWDGSEDELRRLSREREILAKLRHPGIAQLYGGGDVDGRPYLVMEYVDGTPITEYCDDHRLSTSARLDLLRRVCDGVHYAHQNLVVHGDLKPSNILVTHEGVPKLLDFGIAGLLVQDPGGAMCAPNNTVAAYTPGYCAPEQLRNEPLTTGADVYSLGVLAYEVVVGVHPLQLKDSCAPGAEGLAARNEVPHPSRTLSGRARKVARDLGNVLLRALEVEPGRRYPSARSLSDDLHRYLRGHAVSAQSPTVWYRLSKHFRRHRIGTAAVLAGLLALTGGLGLTTWQASVARQRAVEAEAAIERSRRVNAFLQGVLATANPSWYVGQEVKGPDVTVLEALEAASRRMETELEGDPEVRADIHHTLGDTYRALLRHEEMRHHFDASLALRRQIYEAPHPKLAEAMYYSSVSLSRDGEWAAAEALLADAVSMQRLRDEGNNLPFMLQGLVSFRLAAGDVDRALAIQTEAADMFRARYGPGHVYHATVPAADVRLVRVLLETGRVGRARALFERLEAEALDPAVAADVQVAGGLVLAAEGSFREAERRVLGSEAARPLSAHELLWLAVRIYLPAGRLEESRVVLNEAAAMWSAESENRPVSAQEAIRAEAALAYVDARLGRVREASERVADLEVRMKHRIAAADRGFFWEVDQLLAAARGHLELRQGRVASSQGIFTDNLEEMERRGIRGVVRHRAEDDLALAAQAAAQLPLDHLADPGARRVGGG